MRVMSRLLLLVLAAACGSPSSDRPDAARADGGGMDAQPDAGSDAGADGGVDAGVDAGEDSGVTDGGTIGGCEGEIRGRFEIMSNAMYGSVFASFGNGPDLFLGTTKVLERGNCKLYTGDPDLVCNPTCNNGEFCSHSGCVPYPESFAVGTIRLRGTMPELDLVPQAGNVYYSMENYPMLIPDGATARLEVDGDGNVDPFTLEVRNVVAIEAPDTMVTVREHEDAVLTWTVAGADDDIVMVEMDSDHHGAVGSIRCEARNGDGMVVVDKELVDGIIEAGRSGIGTYIENSFMTRLNRDRIATDRGCAELSALQMDWFFVETILAP